MFNEGNDNNDDDEWWHQDDQTANKAVKLIFKKLTTKPLSKMCYCSNFTMPNNDNSSIVRTSVEMTWM